MMQEGRFPRSRRIGKAAAAWLESEVEEWIRKQAYPRDNPAFNE
jgi:predicted DNA-binding transcriptional regulator AlpA